MSTSLVEVGTKKLLHEDLRLDGAEVCWSIVMNVVWIEVGESVKVWVS